MKHLTNLKWMMVFLPLIFLGACGGSDVSSPETGTLSLSMVDGSDETFKAVYVTIKEIQVCHEKDSAGGNSGTTCKWETIATLNKTYNLLNLVDGVMATLGQKDLPVGVYRQMRLILARDHDGTNNILNETHLYPQYLIRLNNDICEMKVPSGYQTGIKLVHPFEIIENLTTELILDFDVTRSIHLAGTLDSNEKYILKPTIKVIGTYNRAVVTGVVSDDADPAEPIAGALVTAWKSDNGSLSLAGDTPTNADGGYTLYLGLGGELELSPQGYLLVVTKNGYNHSCGVVTVEADMTYTQDFILSQATNVTVSGTITGTIDPNSLPAGATYPTVHLSFKQIGDCFPDPVETVFQDIGDEANYDTATGNFEYAYEIVVPDGTYDIEASTDGLASVDNSGFAIIPPGPVQLDIAF